jgi:hypothetical protein
MSKLQRKTIGTPYFQCETMFKKPGKEILASISGSKGSLLSSQDSSIDWDTTALPGTWSMQARLTL